MALDAAPESLEWENGAWVGADGATDPTQVKTVEQIALYAHGTGELPPGVEGGLDAQTVYTGVASGAASSSTSTSSTTLSVPNSVE